MFAGTKQKTIYEYHRVNFGRAKVLNNTLITLYAQPTCYSFKDCQSCMNHEGAEFKVGILLTIAKYTLEPPVT